MARIQQILKRARNVLADPKAERWSDSVLLDLIDDAHKDLCIHSKILTGTYLLPLEKNVRTYPLPDDIWLITRATFDDSNINLLSSTYLDELSIKIAVSDRAYDRRERQYGSFDPIDLVKNSDWATDTGPSVQAVIYDRRNINEITVYPIPDGSQVGAFVPADPIYGVTTTIDGSYENFNDIYGVLTSIVDDEENVESLLDGVYGVTIGIQDSVYLKIWYISAPGDLTETTDILLTHPMFDRALRYYVIGQAFMTDIDVRNKDKSSEYLNLYNRELGIAEETEGLDAARKSFESTTYRTGFEP